MSGSGALQPNSGLRYHTDADSPLPETINPIIDVVETNSTTIASHLADIVQTTEVNSSTKYPSAAVTYQLAQSVAGIRNAYISPGVSDLNTISRNFWITPITSTTSNAPFTGYGICLQLGGGGYTAQIAINVSANEMFHRSKAAGWSSWKKINSVGV